VPLPNLSSVLQVSDNGGVTYISVPLPNVTQINVFGLGGYDTLTVDNSNGFVAPALSGTLQINFTGTGHGQNKLVLQGSLPGIAFPRLIRQGSPLTRELLSTTWSSRMDWSPSKSPSPAEFHRGLDEQLLTSVNLNQNNHLVQIIDGPTVNGFKNDQRVCVDRNEIEDAMEEFPFSNHPSDLTNEAFVPIFFANKVALAINTGSAAGDLIVLNNPNPGAGLASVKIVNPLSNPQELAVRSPVAITCRPGTQLRFNLASVRS